MLSVLPSALFIVFVVLRLPPLVSIKAQNLASITMDANKSGKFPREMAKSDFEEEQGGVFG